MEMGCVALKENSIKFPANSTRRS